MAFGLPYRFQEVGAKQFTDIPEVGFGVGAGAGQTLERLVQNRNDPPLLLYVLRNPVRLAVNVIAVQGRNSSSGGKTRKVDVLQEVVDETGVVSVKVFYVQSSVERPEIFFDEEHVSNAAASTSCNTGSLNFRFGMCVGWTAGCNKWERASLSALLRQIKTSLKSADLPQRLLGPT